MSIADRADRLIRQGFDPIVARDAANVLELLRGHHTPLELQPSPAPGHWHVTTSDGFVVTEAATDLQALGFLQGVMWEHATIGRALEAS
jgi:hypothetical protein